MKTDRVGHLIIAGTTAAVTAAFALTACSSAAQPTAPPATSTTAPVSGSITVFGAASLKAVFTTLGSQFEKDHPGTTVTFSFAGSSDLAAQIQQGAPADVFASADSANMSKVGDAGLLAAPAVNFASNTLTIVTAPGNPKGIATFADLTRAGLSVVVCAPQVPCGSAEQKVEKATGVDVLPVSEESSVTDVLGKVTSGQADAGLVYVTDATAAGPKVTAVPFPESAGAVNTYPIARLAASANPATAQAFADFVAGEQGRRVLAAAGFAAP